MKSEKGLTLLEILVTITVFFIVVGVCFTMFSTVNLFVNTSEEKFNRHTDQNLTINSITKEIADPVELYYSISPIQELRFKNYKGDVKSIRYEATTHTLSFVSSSSNDIMSFNDSQIFVLSENVSNFVLTDQNGGSVPTEVILDSDVLYSLRLTFQSIKPNANGTEEIRTNEVTINIKPFKQ
ncbi:prepilin-type N-terminal cleavage/methylation domain-containing protein [Bacillus salitolerans]|uniref:Prepilin-type N-terminal cleavage/methylation domain-containing protein n=1 Tax=Bacillus salitolerans TaxID=1437434 RepID=A0ABW4LLG1_9BACI